MLLLGCSASSTTPSSSCRKSYTLYLFFLADANEKADIFKEQLFEQFEATGRYLSGNDDALKRSSKLIC